MTFWLSGKKEEKEQMVTKENGKREEGQIQEEEVLKNDNSIEGKKCGNESLLLLKSD